MRPTAQTSEAVAKRKTVEMALSITECHLCVFHQRFFPFPGASLGYSVAPFGLNPPLLRPFYISLTTFLLLPDNFPSAMEYQ